MNMHNAWELELQDIKERLFNPAVNEIKIMTWTERGYDVTGSLHPHHTHFIEWSEQLKNINYTLEEIVFSKNVKFLLDNISQSILTVDDPGMIGKKAYIFNGKILIGHSKDNFLMLYSNKDGWEYCTLTNNEFFSNEFRNILLQS